MMAMIRLSWRPKRGWWHTPVGWLLGWALALPSGLLAIPVSQYVGAWVLPAEVTGLAIALGATVGFFVVKRHSWLLAAPLSIGLSFSLGLGLVEGWSAQLILALNLIRVGLLILALLVAGVVFIKVRHLKSSMRLHARTIGEHLANEGLFRDDGERITVYAPRGRVGLRALLYGAVLALFGAGGLWVLSGETDLFTEILITVSFGLMVGIIGIHTLLLLLRAVMTSPTLVVTADGILDNSSLIVTGRGLLRWNETLGVKEFAYSQSGITHRFLDLDVTDLQDINRRQPLGKRALAMFPSWRQPTGFRILSALLDQPPAVLVTEINHYINTHAPEGSWHKATTDDEAERPGAEPPEH
jgi:hypothetical protein